MKTPSDGEKVLPHLPGSRDNRAVALSDRTAPDDETRRTGPTVVASGGGFLADRIVEEALKAGVPVRTDSDLVQILAEMEIGEEVPVEAFAAVAEVLRHVYQRNAQAKPGAAAVTDAEPTSEGDAGHATRSDRA